MNGILIFVAVSSLFSGLHSEEVDLAPDSGPGHGSCFIPWPFNEQCYKSNWVKQPDCKGKPRKDAHWEDVRFLLQLQPCLHPFLEKSDSEELCSGLRKCLDDAIGRAGLQYDGQTYMILCLIMNLMCQPFERFYRSECDRLDSLGVKCALEKEKIHSCMKYSGTSPTGNWQMRFLKVADCVSKTWFEEDVSPCVAPAAAIQFPSQLCMGKSQGVSPFTQHVESFSPASLDPMETSAPTPSSSNGTHLTAKSFTPVSENTTTETSELALPSSGDGERLDGVCTNLSGVAAVTCSSWLPCQSEGHLTTVSEEHVGSSS
ncbi:uncharacterized protein LOC102349206 [Latimeria chalumnae]|uniref:uncharacterized protein LOC102349206 n=1 Tax=Latimeria chalumnae TaxID=7897 RepID=UPI00313E4751